MHFDDILNKFKQDNCETEQVEDRFYTRVADELEKNYRDKGTYVKSIVESKGDKNKLESIYIRLRAKALQDDFYHKVMLEKHKEEKIDAQIKKKEKILHIDKFKIFIHFENEIINKGFEKPWYYGALNFRKHSKIFYGEINSKSLKIKLSDKDDNVALELDIKPYLMEQYPHIDW